MSPLLAIGIALVALVLVGVLDRLALRLLRPARRPPGRTPDDLGLSFRPWQIPGDPPLEGWWIDGDDPAGPVVLLVHGWGANGGVLLPLARTLERRTSALVTVDVRGHGRSDHAVPLVSLRQFRDDTLRTVQALAPEAAGRPIVLVGHSMGGAAGVLAAEKGAPLAGIVLLASPFDVYAAMARYLDDHGLPGSLLVPVLKPFFRVHIGVRLDSLHPGHALRRIGIPVLVVQPGKDRRVVPEDGRRLAEAAGRPAVVIPDAGHTDVLEHPRTGELVAEFLHGLT